MSEKSKPPTKKRLEDAEKEGQVAQTPSIAHLLATVGTIEMLGMTRDLWLSQAPLLLGSYISRLSEAYPDGKFDVKDMLVPLGGLALAVILATLLLASVLGLVGNLAQTGVVVATKGFMKLERMNPVNHAKQLFSAEQLGQLLMNAVKVTAIFGCCGLGVLMSMDSLLRLGDGTLMQAAQVVVEVILRCERLALLVLIVSVAIDWVIRKRSHIKSLRMSHEEVEREQKDQFGDKHVRKQRNEFRRDMLAGQMTENTRQANAVVTNPTHFAVALLYDPEKFPLPVVMARGADEAAALMRRIAREAGIPIIRSPQLARTLYSVGRQYRPVPRLTLKAVAAVYRVVAEIKAGERHIDDYIELDPEEGQ